jgi:uncharacterized coiled-coil protein SlyX
MKTKTSQTKTSICRTSFYRERVARLLIALVLAFAWFALVPQARAVCQEGCLTNENTVLGDDALVNNTGSFDTAIGWEALLNNIGIGNTATGAQALYANTTGNNLTAYGVFALFSNTTGINNTAIGLDALSNNTTGSDNIGIGFQAGFRITTGIHNIDIGNSSARESESKTIRIGTSGVHTKTFIAGISRATIPTGVPVIVDDSGHLGVTTSSERFKEAVKPMAGASEAILSLKPVTFRYKKDLDPDGVPQFGLVAEEVEKVNPDLVAHDEQGKPYTVRYEAVNAMLLNEFLKEHRKVQEQEATIAELKSAAAKQEANASHQQKQIDALNAGLQKVSAQLQLSKSLPQTVLNSH